MSVVVRKFLRNLLPAAALAAVLGFGGFSAGELDAGVIVVNPTPTAGADVRARIRWGGANWETALLDPTLPTPNDTTPQGGASKDTTWTTMHAYRFEVNYKANTGVFDLQVDYDRNGSFAGDGSERISHQFNAIGMGYYGIQIYGAESSTATSQVTNLRIKTNLNIAGTSIGTLTPTPTVGTSRLFRADYKDINDSLLSDITIEGNLTFLTNGTANESPSWNFSLTGPAAVPEPGSLSLLAVGLAGLVGVRRRRS